MNLNDRVALHIGRMIIQLHEKELQLEQAQQTIAALEQHLTQEQTSNPGVPQQ